MNGLAAALRAVRIYALWWLFTALWVTLMWLAMLATLFQAKSTLGTAMTRVWGRTCLAIAGVRLEVDAACQAELTRRRGCVYVFNHTSTLDLLVGGALMPPGGVTIAKREMLLVPFVGWAMLVLNFVLVNRGNRQAATESLNRTAERVNREKLSILIAPEGTRSPDGQLGPFKLGAFHMAVAAQVPVVAIRWRGCAELWPRNRAVPRAGMVRVEFLGTTETGGMAASDVHRLAEGVRGRFLGVDSV